MRVADSADTTTPRSTSVAQNLDVRGGQLRDESTFKKTLNEDHVKASADLVSEDLQGENILATTLKPQKYIYKGLSLPPSRLVR